MTRYLIWGASTAALVAAFSCPVDAQSSPMVCGDGQEVRHALTQGHGERLEGEGLSGNGAAVQLYTSRDGSTWTMLLTLPGGPTCLIGAGKSWEKIQPPKPQPETRTN